MIVPLDPYSEVVDNRRRLNPEWYTWVLDVTETLRPGLPVTTISASVVVQGKYVICNRAGGTTTLSLPNASLFPMREILVKTIQAQAVVSASANVCPSTSDTPGTAILPATDGAWAHLVSDGVNWIIMAAQPLI